MKKWRWLSRANGADDPWAGGHGGLQGNLLLMQDGQDISEVLGIEGNLARPPS